MTGIPQAQQCFSELYPDLFASLTRFETTGIDEALAASRLNGLTYTRDDVARLIDAIIGDLSTAEFLQRIR